MTLRLPKEVVFNSYPSGPPERLLLNRL
ncbi:hypothetical protein BGLA2_470013 [Burkholderia gladioli]|nr:hypothetical protein BGLA2_470013 [Burkholderia gladioli]